MSSNGFPSMTALLGLLAVAGFQNRDKIAEMLGGLGQAGGAASRDALPGGLGGLLGGLVGAGGARAPRTGFSREELLTKLSTLLPTAIDRYTPEGRIPAAG